MGVSATHLLLEIIGLDECVGTRPHNPAVHLVHAALPVCGPLKLITGSPHACCYRPHDARGEMGGWYMVGGELLSTLLTLGVRAGI